LLILSPGQFESASDIGTLRALVAAAKQDDQNVAALAIVDPISGAVIDPHFGDAFADRLTVAEITVLGARDASGDTCFRFRIS
jgi:hypothetical protein